MKRKRTAWVILLFVITAIVYNVVRYNNLGSYRVLIEQNFASELNLIEQKSLEHPSYYDESRFEWINNIKVLFDRELSHSAICSASWSSDGHHGLMGLKNRGPGTGMHWTQWLWNRNADGTRSLGYGATNDGQSLLVLHGYNRHAEKRHYMVAFFRDAVDEMAR